MKFQPAYVSAKHGLVGFTKAAALEGGKFGITANAICSESASSITGVALPIDGGWVTQ